MANPALYKTPPYVTANPEVEVYSLGGSSTSVPETKDSTSALTQDSGDSLVAAAVPPAAKPTKAQGPIKQFIVMATDGLYDCLSSEEVVALVGAHLSGQKATQTKQELLSVLGTSFPAAASSASPHKPRPPPSGAQKGDDATVKRYVFEDSNLSTHLTRNALGGALKEQVSALLSIPAPQCRRYRDDITITVLLFDSEASQREAEVKVSEKSELLQGVRRIWEGKERSKL
jgi:pyruvate dehydrogenase phosphatase